MKTLRLIGMAIVAIVMSVNFTACSDDDDDIDIAQLEGTWGLVRDEGYEHYEGEKESWNDSYDPANPTEDCEKIVISKVADNTYSFASSYYYGNQWHTGDTGKFTLDGNKLIPVDGDAGEFAELVVANSNELVIETKGTDEDGEYYNKMIAHMVKQFDISLHRVTNRDELEQLLEVTPVTHLFVGEEEYRVNKNYLEMTDSKVRIVVVTGKNIILPQEKRIEIIRKPLCTQSVLNILKEKESDLSKRKKRKMICPGIKVLVVDDEPMNLTVAKGIFENYQMIVKTVISGKEAIAACEKERFDIIFLDHMMPEMDGIETLKQLRKMQKESGQEYIIVAFTANAVSGAKKMFMEEGFDEFVSKPIETMTLERVLCKVLPKSSITYISEEKEAVKTDERKTNFDRNAGLQYCRGDEMFYRELLVQFHSESVKKRQMIEADYEQKNMEDYRIRVHALKSTAKMIGAENLSDLAKDLEMAAKEKDWDFIEKNHKEVLDQYAAAVVEIGSLLGTAFEEEEFSVTQINSEKLLEELMLLMEKLRAYEIDDAEKIIQKLQHIKCANLSGRELIENIKQDVTDFEFDRALNKTEKLYKRVERGECE